MAMAVPSYGHVEARRTRWESKRCLQIGEMDGCFKTKRQVIYITKLSYDRNYLLGEVY